ncbi:TetR/AcrR family transcriptional regulator [Lentibacillus sediminis]|uniref:TetR/AcrR family transcriptional regulator n=1 Tax=Lentibacillus sediminis TaxID=1940529 RepID=UPI001EFD1A45|nr:TetR/AcrR family transcriptional regulator [Lentibacillus sediminis]
MINNKEIDKRIKRTKKAFQEALLSLMQEKDFKAITITSIVQLADYNRGTFYKHYRYKEDLLHEIIEDVISDLIVSYREPYKEMETLKVSSLTSSAVKIFQHVREHADFYSLIIRSNALPGFYKRISNELKKLSLQELTYVKSELNIDPDLHASYQSYAILGMIVEWVENSFKFSPEYMAEQLLEILHFTPAEGEYRTTGR